jgi:hypothetical protein
LSGIVSAAALHCMAGLSVHPYARSHWIPTTSMQWGEAGTQILHLNQYMQPARISFLVDLPG